MRLVITPQESAALDAQASHRIGALMEQAGLWVAVAAADMGAGYGTRVAVLAGPGNNGGDAYVAAKHLKRRGAAVTVHARSQPKGDESRVAAAAAAAAGVRTVPLGRPEPADLVVDGLFGVGFHGDLPEDVLPWLDHPAPLLAIDVPSGLNATDGSVAGSVFTATRTVTFHALKVGHLVGEGPDRCGTVEVRDIGLEGGRPELLLTEEGDVPLPPRERVSHKWSAGSVLVVGGSPGLTGAVALAGVSALEAGAGAVAAAVPGRWQAGLDALNPGLITVGIGDGVRFEAADAAAVLDYGSRFDVLALGPGLGPDQDKLVEEVLAGRQGPLLIDADGLNAIGSLDMLTARRGPTILTPHAGEFARLAGRSATYAAARELATGASVVVLLKGNPTFVVGDDAPWVVTTGGPELATIGTGDVLTGMVAAYWARGLDALSAARAGAFWHGRAGSRLAERSTVTAERLVGEVGRVPS